MNNRNAIDQLEYAKRQGLEGKELVAFALLDLSDAIRASFGVTSVDGPAFLEAIAMTLGATPQGWPQSTIPETISELASAVDRIANR